MEYHLLFVIIIVYCLNVKGTTKQNNYEKKQTNKEEEDDVKQSESPEDEESTFARKINNLCDQQ